ncbi:MAG: PspC domain-containing protein [Candidatus Diapherotrites archaeon]|uniref:PspC domain-containing protein n=1 Tax=Candidatus Iainarchaeum sp. TaxID=3101447 RepID=A0A8T4C820_9ARCH|nr:PspC domain-containing protein [Candidatus Diapherotrites archaeon]
MSLVLAAIIPNPAIPNPIVSNTIFPLPYHLSFSLAYLHIFFAFFLFFHLFNKLSFSFYTTASVKRLYRSTKDRMLGGVCGGIAVYFQVDPTLVRLAWILLTLAWGAGLILYILAWIIVPAHK